MTEAEAADRVMACIPESDRAQFGPLAMVILYAIIGGVVSWFVQRMLNRCTARGMRSPNSFARWQLNCAIHRACRAAAERPVAAAERMSVDWIEAALAPVARAALLAAAAGVADHELEAMRAQRGREGS